MVGNYLGSSPRVLNLEEFSGFFFSSYIAEREYFRVPSPVKREYIEFIASSTYAFARQKVKEAGLNAFVDSTPWNLMILKQLMQRFPNGVYVICLRRIEGVILSLKRSYSDGYLWAGDNFSRRASLWMRMYMNIDRSDFRNIFIFNYDELCRAPLAEVERLDSFFRKKTGGAELDRLVFLDSHASSTSRRTVAHLEENNVKFLPMPSFDQDEWNLELSQLSTAELAIVQRANCVYSRLEKIADSYT